MARDGTARREGNTHTKPLPVRLPVPPTPGWFFGDHDAVGVLSKVLIDYDLMPESQVFKYQSLELAVSACHLAATSTYLAEQPVI